MNWLHSRMQSIPILLLCILKKWNYLLNCWCALSLGLVMTDKERLTFLEEKVKMLEQENIETTNALYEVENRLQAQIDALINYTMSMKDWEEPNDVY